MRPIPRALLIHTATLNAGTPDAWQSGERKTIAKLSRVRVEPLETQERTTEDTHTRPSATLLYDVRNSLPKNVAFAPGQTVIFQERLYRVETVERCYDGRRLHHVELGLND